MPAVSQEHPGQALQILHLGIPETAQDQEARKEAARQKVRTYLDNPQSRGCAHHQRHLLEAKARRAHQSHLGLGGVFNYYQIIMKPYYDINLSSF